MNSIELQKLDLEQEIAQLITVEKIIGNYITKYNMTGEALFIKNLITLDKDYKIKSHNYIKEEIELRQKGHT